MRWSALLSLLLAAVVGATKEPYLKTHDETFIPDAVLRVTEEDACVGCINRNSVAVNGSVPGPELQFVSGSVVWIRVYNDMTDHNLTMHWHGLTMAAAPFADGSPAASQWAIAPLKFFDYEINLVDIEPGTYFYHSHVGFQAMTAAGALVITNRPGQVSPYQYDEEQNVIFSDLYNTTDQTIETGLVANPFKWSGEVGDVLVNGYGISQYPATNDAESCSLAQISVEAGKTYRLRFIGATALSFLSVGFEEHNLTLIEADGAYTEPLEVSFIQIGGGQRYSALLKTWSCDELASQASGRSQFYIQIETRDRPANLTTYAILDYGDSCSSGSYTPPVSLPTNGLTNGVANGITNGLPTNTPPHANATTLSRKIPPRTPPLHLPPTVQGWLDYDLHPLSPDTSAFPTAAEVTRTVVMDIYQLGQDGYVKWTQNGISWYEHTPKVPYLVALYTNASALLPDYSYAVASGTGRDDRVAAWPARIGEVLEIVVQNTGSYSGGMDVHPMHMHGAHYYYLGSGRGTYDRDANEERLAGRVPVTRDTTMLYRYSEKEEPKKPHSWIAWRIKVTQPGVWMLHCHTLQHMIMGMQTVWVFGNSTDILTLPLPMVEGYLAYGGDVYGDDDHAPQVIHFFDADDDDDEKDEK
ncbi:Multicopper oxidase type 1 [Neofusicoccum parvum]|uniref:Multicopper oxidase type 1 n=1 Tax=Neofusicoccum parvum TaxID=310453 RepID=A0ACB5RYX7_9PEZI|nr:Multicopper oxidase type 1 [Neofusicoccum parvum]